MKKVLIIILLAVNVSWAITDLDGQDCVINMGDFAVFARQWQLGDSNITDANADYNSDNIVDYNDLLIFTGAWLDKDMNNPCPWDVDYSPTAADVNAATYEFYRETIALSGSDDNYGGSRIHYIITSLPTGAYLTDPAVSGGLITASLLPYRISENGNEVVFTTDTNGLYSFNYKVNDGVNDSNTAVVDVNVAENPQDCLNYDGVNGENGFYVIDDNDLLELKSGQAFCVKVKTREPDLTIMKKRAGGAGYEVKLYDGVPVVQVYDANGLFAEFDFYYPINDDRWTTVRFVWKYNAGSEHISGYDIVMAIDKFDEDGAVNNLNDGVEINLYYDEIGSAGSFENNEPLKVTNKKGAIDRLAFYQNVNPADFMGTYLGFYGSGIEGRNLVGNGLYANSPTVRFMFSGDVVDEILGITGTIADSNVVGFEPFEVDLRNVIKADRWYSEDGFVNRNGEDLGSNDKFRFRR